MTPNGVLYLNTDRVPTALTTEQGADWRNYKRSLMQLGEVLREDYLVPLGLSVNALSVALGVPSRPTRLHAWPGTSAEMQPRGWASPFHRPDVPARPERIECHNTQNR